MDVNVSSVLDRISVLQHSCVRIQSLNPALVIYFDPFQMDDIPCDADVVFITHAHYDHYSPDDIDKVSNSATVYVLPASMKSREITLQLGGADRCTFLPPNSSFEVAGLPVETVPAYNIGKEFHPKANEWVGYVITVDGVRVYVSGDMDDTPDARQVRCDVALVPVGGKFTMTAEEAAVFVGAIKPQVAVPTHYGSIVGKPEDGPRFAQAVQPPVEAIVKMGA